MAYSEIAISNMALAMLGADSIRSFDEKNKRSRMCKRFYDSTRDYMLSKFDWPFARAFKNLKQLDLSDEDVPINEKAFQLPPDCRTPRDVHPPGSSTNWRIVSNRLYTELDSIGLYYTKKEVNSSLFSDTFINALASGLAVRLCVPITQDKALVKTIYQVHRQDLLDAQESDANIGNDYRTFDEDPENDSFVTGEALGAQRSLVPEALREYGS